VWKRIIAAIKELQRAKHRDAALHRSGVGPSR
jgi:hypothetical protein